MKRYYAYENFRDDTQQLLKRVAKEFAPDGIVAIARGGYTLGHAMAEGLGIRDLQSIQTELYDGDQKRSSITLRGDCHFAAGSKVVVVDDIADSGETLRYVMEHLTSLYPQVTFASATLFYKKTSCYEPTYWVAEATCWIDFFWEHDFTH